MGRKRSHKKTIDYGLAAKPPGASMKKMEDYEDTLEEGGVDDFMFKRDQIKFNPQADSDDDDLIGEEGDEVLSLNLPSQHSDDEDEEDYDEEDEEVVLPKEKKKKAKEDKSAKGRFGKPIVDSDEEEASSSGSGSGSGSEEEEEGWGRQYYSKPSNARAKEKEGVFDEKREEEREMEETEIKRLQRKSREAMSGAEDWGLEEVELNEIPTGLEETAKPAIQAPETNDPAILMRHLEAYEPLKLALVRDFPLVVNKLKKTARGIKKMEDEVEGEEQLHKGLGWLHYQTLLTYATTLAFYVHLAYLPPATRPDFTTHPILPRLLQLKEGVAMLEDLDFAAGSEDGDRLVLYEGDDDDEEISDEEGELQALMDAKKELVIRMKGAEGTEWEDDADDLWTKEGLEDGELDDLLDDAEMDLSKEEQTFEAPKKKKKTMKKALKMNSESNHSTKAAFEPLAEPAFFSTKKSQDQVYPESDDILGDATSLADADATDKEKRKRSLQFHTSKIAATSARRNAARKDRMGGDEDLPYRDKRAARDSALRKNGPKGDGGEDLDGKEWSEGDRKRAREAMGQEEEQHVGGEDDGDGYYELVKRRRTEEKDTKREEHETRQAEKLASVYEDESASGPRSLTRAIEKNRGLTPHRSKTGRNPRVKKRLAYEKAKQKVGSQRAVYKGGQSAQGGAYEGEKTGISTVVKSRKF
ncbi:U3 small nucleolar RNA-associated protein 3, partial [Tremellales sp. Uapishka_1]